MKDWKFTIIIFLLVIVCALSVKLFQNTGGTRIDDNEGDSWKVIVIDSCEYIERFEGHAGLFAHKGNCKFCKERNKNNN